MGIILLSRAREALQECESRLRGLLADAAAAGDYDAALELTEWARHVASLRRVSPHVDQTPVNADGVGCDQDDGNALLLPRVPTHTATPGRRQSAIRRSRRRRKPAARTYPKFVRLNEDLHKIGWSKKAKKEYEHKAPREVVDLLAERLVEVGTSGELFTTEDIFPLGRHDDSEIPSYQAYLALAWLRALGVLVQHGRQGYTLATTPIKPLIEAAWAKLPRP